ncbi:MAG: YceD family protein [Nitrospiraceae bacterium]|nr:YceD family protein [Nitrospiraceae bacterium]
MAIKINDIPPEGLTVEIEDRLDLSDEGATLTPFMARIKLVPGGSGTIHVTGTVDADPELECSRCLKRFPYPVRNAVMEFDVLPERAEPSASEQELNKADLDAEFYRGDEIDPAAFIREQVLLAIPMVPVHSETCKGLCPVCGTDWNEKSCTCARDAMPARDNPFAVLKKIIKPEKE